MCGDRKINARLPLRPALPGPATIQRGARSGEEGGITTENDAECRREVLWNGQPEARVFSGCLEIGRLRTANLRLDAGKGDSIAGWGAIFNIKHESC